MAQQHAQPPPQEQNVYSSNCSSHVSTLTTLATLTQQLDAFSDTMAGFTGFLQKMSVLENNLERNDERLDGLCSDIREIKTALQQSLVAAAEDRGEYRLLKKNVDDAHAIIRELKDNNSAIQGLLTKHIEEDLIFRTDFKAKARIYGGIGLLIAGALPFLPNIFIWLGQLFTHMAAVAPSVPK